METAVTTNPHIPVDPAPADSTITKSNFAGASVPPPAVQTNPLRRWVNHLAVALFLALCTVLGIWLALVPWSLQWTDNPLLWTHPDLRTFLGYGFVRGLCSGLGILDLWIGIREAAEYYERLGILK